MLLWALAFVILAHQWRLDPGPPPSLGMQQWPASVVNNAQAAVVFAFFSVFAWVASIYSALVRLTRSNTETASFGSSSGMYFGCCF